MSRGDVLSERGRFAPLDSDHPSVGATCVLCGASLHAGQRPALIEWAPAGDEEAEKAAEGRAHTVECRLAHEDCAFEDEEGGETNETEGNMK